MKKTTRQQHLWATTEKQNKLYVWIYWIAIWITFQSWKSKRETDIDGNSEYEYREWNINRKYKNKSALRNNKYNKREKKNTKGKHHDKKKDEIIFVRLHFFFFKKIVSMLEWYLRNKPKTFAL